MTTGVTGGVMGGRGVLLLKLPLAPEGKLVCGPIVPSLSVPSLALLSCRAAPFVV